MNDAKTIIAKVCERTGVSREEMLGDRRFDPVVRARHRAMYALRKSPTAAPQAGQAPGNDYTRSLPTIAAMFGRHHTTVLTGIRAHAKRMEAAE